MTPDLTLVGVAVPVVAGFAGGLVNAVAGGGSLLLFPALVWVGLPPVTANVTNAVSLWPGYLSSVAAGRADLRTPGRQKRVLVAASSVAALGGALALLLLPATSFEVVVPFLVLFASLLLLFQPALARRVSTAHVDADGVARRPAWLLPATVGAGAYGGYFGGVVGVLLLAVVGLSGIVRGPSVPALKNLLQFTINTVALVVFVVSGIVAWQWVLFVAPAALAGGWLGGRLVGRIPAEGLRWGVGLFGVGVAVVLFVG